MTTETPEDRFNTELAAAQAARDASADRLEEAMAAHMQAVARLHAIVPYGDGLDESGSMSLSPPFYELLSSAVSVALKRVREARNTQEEMTPEEKREIYGELAHDVKELLERLKFVFSLQDMPTPEKAHLFLMK